MNEAIDSPWRPSGQWQSNPRYTHGRVSRQTQLCACAKATEGCGGRQCLIENIGTACGSFGERRWRAGSVVWRQPRICACLDFLPSRRGGLDFICLNLRRRAGLYLLIALPISRSTSGLPSASCETSSLCPDPAPILPSWHSAPTWFARSQFLGLRHVHVLHAHSSEIRPPHRAFCGRGIRFAARAGFLCRPHECLLLRRPRSALSQVIPVQCFKRIASTRRSPTALVARQQSTSGRTSAWPEHNCDARQ